MRRLQPVTPSTGDVIAGVSVALVLIPQSVAYAVLAGASAEQGLIVGCVATIAAAPFVSSPWLQTGPVAITSLLTFGALATVATPGTSEYLALAALLALLVGVVRVLIGLARGGVLAYLMSQPVLVGFTPGAAVVIAASQLPAAVGVESGGAAVMSGAFDALTAVTRWEPTSVVLSAATVAIVLLARRRSPLLPGVLVAVVAGLVFSHLAGYPGEVVGELPRIVPSISLALPWAATSTLLLPAVVIALVGFAEAGAISRTFAAETRTRWDPDREFISQGVANLAAGAFGGFPAGGSFSRSALNRAAGATTRWSGAITGAAALAFLPIASLLERLPLSVLAGVIIAAVVKLVDLRPLRRLWDLSRPQFVVAAATFALTLLLAPRIQWAVVIGIVGAVLVHLRRELRLEANEWTEGATVHLRPQGVLYFGSATALETRLGALLQEHPEAEELVIHFDGLGRVDVTGAMAVRSFCQRAAPGIDITLTDLTAVNRGIICRAMQGCPGTRIEDAPPGRDEVTPS